MVSRSDRRALDAALATLGRSLVRVRDSRAWEAEGFASFDAFARMRVAERLGPLVGWAAVVNDHEVDEVVERALMLAGKRGRR